MPQISKLLENTENIESRLVTLEEKINIEIKTLSKKVEEMEKSQHFINFEEHKIH